MATTPTGSTIYLPDAMNQFTRLIRVSGPKGTGSYVAGDEWNNYVNGRDYDSLNCTATVGALLRDSHTMGKQRSTPIAIRNHQGDFNGGIGWDDVNVAWWDLFGERLTIPPYFDWADVIYALRQGRDVGIQGDYDQIPWAYQWQKGGTFDHAFSLHGYRSSDGRVLLGDPLGKKFVWVPQYVIRGAAEKLALAQRGTRSRLFVTLTKILTKPATQTTGWRVSIGPPPTPRPYWQYIMDRNETYIVDRVPHDTKGWSARSTPPVRRRPVSTAVGKHGLEAKYYSLVKISDKNSSYNQVWVAAGYAEDLG